MCENRFETLPSQCNELRIFYSKTCKKIINNLKLKVLKGLSWMQNESGVELVEFYNVKNKKPRIRHLYMV